MDNLALKSLPLKEKLAVVLCVSFATLFLLAGIYHYLIANFIPRELLMAVGVCFIFFSAGLTPKLFFLPLTEVLKPEKISTLGNPKIQVSLGIIGFLFSTVGLIWRLLQ